MTSADAVRELDTMQDVLARDRRRLNIRQAAERRVEAVNRANRFLMPAQMREANYVPGAPGCAVTTETLDLDSETGVLQHGPDIRGYQPPEGTE